MTVAMYAASGRVGPAGHGGVGGSDPRGSVTRRAGRPDEASEPIRVVIADRSLLLRNLLRRIAPSYGVRVVGETASGVELVEMCRQLQPDVTISDVELEDGDLEAHLAALLAIGTKVLALCDVCAPDRLVAVLVGGASGYLLHDASPQQLLDGVQAVASGAAAFDPKVAGTILQQWRNLRSRSTGIARTRRPLLTPREEDVLRAMVEGLPAKAIARRLGVATKTVENHKIRIFDKLGVRTQAQAVSLAIGQGLLTVDPGRNVPPPAAVASGPR